MLFSKDCAFYLGQLGERYDVREGGILRLRYSWVAIYAWIGSTYR